MDALQKPQEEGIMDDRRASLYIPRELLLSSLLHNGVKMQSEKKKTVISGAGSNPESQRPCIAFLCAMQRGPWTVISEFFECLLSYNAAGRDNVIFHCYAIIHVFSLNTYAMPGRWFLRGHEILKNRKNAKNLNFRHFLL